MQRLTLCLFALLLVCSSAQFTRKQPNLNIPNLNNLNLNGFLSKIFDTLRQQDEVIQAQIPQIQVPAQNQQSKPKDVSPSPQCLSQTYQTLSLLYSFESDSMAQDISQLSGDYTSLSSVIQKINNFCMPRVEIDTSAPSPIEQDCSDSLDRISDIMAEFSSGDTTNYINVIKTVQQLGFAQGNFTRDCSGPKKSVKKTVAAPVKKERTCEDLFIKANDQVSKINEDALSNDLHELLEGFSALKETLIEVNQICEESLRINVFPPNRIVFGTCADHFEELRKLTTYDGVSNLDETASNVKRVWNMLHKFLQSC